jgi:hypothetical protein
MDEKQKKYILLGVLVFVAIIAVVFRIIKSGSSSQTTTQNATPPPPVQSNPRPTQAFKKKTTKSLKKFTGYEKIIVTDFSDKENKIIYKDLRNIFKDFKLSAEMMRQAKEIIFSLENSIRKYEEKLSNNSNLIGLSEYINEAKKYLRIAREAFDNKNYLKAQIYGLRAKTELSNIKNTSGNKKKTAIKRGPSMNYYYKGFIFMGNKKMALLKQVITMNDENGTQKQRLLKKYLGDVILMDDGDKYKIVDITDTNLQLQSINTPNIKRTLSINNKF